MQANAEKMLEDDRVVITKWTFPPGTDTGAHVHALDYVVVHLTDGVLTITSDAGEVEVPVTQHAVKSGEAGVAHNMLNHSADTVAFIEIEMKPRG